MARFFRYFGDINRAETHAPEASRLLTLLESRINLPLGVESLTEHKQRYDGTIIRVLAQPMASYAHITSPPPIGGKGEEISNIVIYLVTIAIPARLETDWVEFGDYDDDGLHIYKTYAYKLDERDGVKNPLQPTGIKIALTTNEWATGSGIVLPMQEGFIAGKQSHYAQLSHTHTHEEELGSIDWRAFQAGGGWSLINPGTPDTNTYWGKEIVRFMKMATYGSKKALKSPNPLTTLADTFAARKNYVIDGATITYVDLVYHRNVIQEYMAPPYWNWNYGEGMCNGIVEYLNPNYRLFFKHYISATNTRTGAVKTTLIGEDEHMLQSTYPDTFTNSNWKYNVPIIAVSDDAALMRIVKMVRTDLTCWEETLTEDLIIGKSTTTGHDGINLKSLSFHYEGGISATSVSGSDTINNGETQGYSLDGCQQDDQEFTFSGGGDYTVSGNSIIAGNNVCGVITATGTCISCGLTASKEIIAQGGHWVTIGSCGVTDDWFVWAGLDNIEIIVGSNKYSCAYRMMVSINPTGICCEGLAYDGECEGNCAGSCTDYRYPLNPAKCYQVYGMASMSKYIWDCE